MKLCMSKQVAIAAFLLLIALSAFADSVYQSPEEFIAEIFADNIPETQVLWVTAELRTEARKILGHELAGLRIRYWHCQENPNNTVYETEDGTSQFADFNFNDDKEDAPMPWEVEE